jgi:hypothetical protein
MPSARTDSRTTSALAVTVSLAALMLASALCAAGCGGGQPAAPDVAPPNLHPAGAAASAVATTPDETDVSVRWAGVGGSADADRLEAARTVALYCQLVEAGQFARAGELCEGRHLWSRRMLAGLSRFHFRTARVFASPDTRTLVLKARVRVHAGRGRPLPDGLAVVFFTLGRAGSAVGGWHITAVSTSPQPSRKGSL